jgi:meso-butanediol dehydrogenase/(S,S)-butanediol dehydrogenase/diacetyl reductase
MGSSWIVGERNYTPAVVERKNAWLPYPGLPGHSALDYRGGICKSRRRLTAPRDTPFTHPRLLGQVALVTGAGRGIGRATALRFAREGCAVAVVDRDEDAAARVAAEVGAGGGDAEAICADVASTAEIDVMATSAEARFGRVDILVNNAYHGEGEELLDTSDETWLADLGGTLFSGFACCRRLVPAMAARGDGRVVNVASVNALAAFGNGAYSAAKAGMISLTKTLAVEYGAHGVRVNAVAPATVRTSAWEAELARDPEVLDRLALSYPLGRIGEPDDVAAAVAFLASDDAGWITGSVLCVDGGLMAGSFAMTQTLYARQTHVLGDQPPQPREGSSDQVR